MNRAISHGPRARAALGRTALLILVVAVGLIAIARPAAANQRGQFTARLGISAGVAIEDAPLGLRGRELRRRIPILFETADRLDVRIETASVGQGFFADDGVLLSENDLDLVVTGRRERIIAMAATLGKAFDQSVVFVWLFEPDGARAAATIPLPGGAEALTTQAYQQLITELAGGGHVRYAGHRDLIFVANIDDEPEAAFSDRMQRVRALLDRAGVPSLPVRSVRAQFVALDRDSYDQYIIDNLAQTAPAGAEEHRHRVVAARDARRAAIPS